MDSWLRQTVTRTALGLAEYVIPVLRHSKFRETGVITPEEFIVAGDFLVHHCPTWQWSVGDKPTKSYLPADKQFLVTRNVPCYKRIQELDNYDEGYEKVIDDDELEGGWVDTHHFAPVDNEESEKPADVIPTSNPVRSVPQSMDNELGDDDEDGDDEEPEDMEAFMQSGMLDEIDTAAVVAKTANLSLNSADNVGAEVDGILRTRTYDLYITYDKYYQTPRMWFYGYDENKRSLTEEQMYEDISQDHAKKTVTMEYHPHLSGPPIPSLHPCRQAEVMLKLIGTMADDGVQLEVHQYMMIFLKFVQAVIPTIEYDYTRQFNLS